MLAQFRRSGPVTGSLERHLDRMDQSTAKKKQEKKVIDREHTHRVGQRRAGTKGRRELDAHSRPGAAPLAGESLAGPDRPEHLREWAPSTPIGVLVRLEAR